MTAATTFSPLPNCHMEISHLMIYANSTKSTVVFSIWHTTTLMVTRAIAAISPSGAHTSQADFLLFLRPKFPANAVVTVAA